MEEIPPSYGKNNRTKWLETFIQIMKLNINIDTLLEPTKFIQLEFYNLICYFFKHILVQLSHLLRIPHMIAKVAHIH